MSRRLLFASYHCYVDPSSGAALATRDVLELMARQGWECQVFCGPVLDFEQEESLEQLLSDQHIEYGARRQEEGPRPFSVFHFKQGGVAIAVYRPGPPFAREPTPQDGAAFLALLERQLERFEPDVVLTYGGHWLAQETIARAKRRGVPVVFGLHNLAYGDAALFRGVDAILVPSEFARERYRRALGIECAALPYPLDWSRIRCPEIEGRYVTFVNPQPYKGLGLFARLALELGRCRSDIPLLVVEGRGTTQWLAQTGLDLSGLSNLHVMSNTPDPRDFYRVSRLVLMPSLVEETFGRVAAEALINRIPVLASWRGAVPEVLAEAGFVFDVPNRYTPNKLLVPDAVEVAPWVATILRLWDDAGAYERERQRCLTAAEAWRPERLAPQYEQFFAGLLRRPVGAR